MLHLAIIGIVCAVSAPSEGTAFIGRKNNESVFCHFEGEQNVTKVFLPSYNVDVYNSSDCAKQKITNRTSSFFYDYIIKQYQNSKKSSCSIIKNAFLEKEKKLHSNVEFLFRKRNLLWTQHSSKFLTKTLRPLMESKHFFFEKPRKEKYEPKNTEEKRSKKFKPKMATKANKKLRDPLEKCNLNSKQKKAFLRLKKIKRGQGKENHLDKIKVADELDLNKRIEKLVKKVALENQEKEKYFGDDYAFIKGTDQGKISDLSERKEIKNSFFDTIKKLFCIRKNIFKNMKRDVDIIVNSFPVNKVRGKDPIAEKMALISSSDVSETNRKTTRLKRNPYSSYNYYGDLAPINRQPYPYSANFITKRNILHSPGFRQVVPEGERMRPRPRNSLENWPFFKKLYFSRRNIHDSRLKRNENEEEPIELPATKYEGSIKISRIRGTQKIKKSTEKICVCSTESTNKGKSLTKENDFGKMILPSLSLYENFKESTTKNLVDVNVFQEYEEVLPDHTLEKPFLERDLKDEQSEYYNPDSNFEAYKSPYYDFMTYSSLLDLDPFEPNLMYKYKLPVSKYVRPFPFSSIRRALKNAWSPYERRFPFERAKRCGGKRCSMPRKCWRSAPLLCVPYIKKSQEDVLKYLIKSLQKMIGKPLPPKRDIFEKTKFKPFLEKAIYPGSDCQPEEEVYGCESVTVSTPAYPEYLDMCPLSFQPPYCPNPKPFSRPSCPCPPSPSRSSCPSCPPCSLNSKFYGGSPYPPDFPYPHSAKINPELLGSFSYDNFSPPQLGQCPVFNSWPPFYSPFMEQINKQHPIQYEEKFATVSPKPTTSATLSTTIATTVTSSTTISNSSQIVVSIPINSNTSNSDYSKTSLAPKVFASDFNPLLSQTVPTTVAESTASTDFEELSFTLSTKSAFPLYISHSPVEQEFFSYTAVPYTISPECVTEINQNSETLSPLPSDQQPLVYNPVHSQNLLCDAYFDKLENTSPSTLQVLEWLSTTSPAPTIDSFQYQSQMKETPKSYQNLYGTSQEYPFEHNQFKKDNKNQKFDLSKNTKEDLQKSLQYDDDLQNERQIQRPEKSSGKKFFRMRHKKLHKSKIKSEPTAFSPPYDYFLYDRYPLMRSNGDKNIKLGRYRPPQLYWKNCGRKIKTFNNLNSLIRRKRKDYDFESDNFENYSDYLDDSNYNDEDLNDHPGTYAKNFTKNYFKSKDTPPSYEMLSKLAKSITEFNATKPDSTTPLSTEITFSTSDSTNQLTKSILGKSSVNKVSSPQKIKSTTMRNDKGKDTNKKPFLQNNSKSSSPPKTFASKTTTLSEPDDMSLTQTSLTTATTDTKSNTKERTIDSKKCGKTTFFQTNSKVTQTSKNSKKDAGKEDKELASNKDIKTEEGAQIPTTLKSAIVIKGLKKSLTKPSPKVYPKVYPESFSSDTETNDTIFASTVTTAKTFLENKTAQLSSTSKPDTRLQLLAVCEGYLEIVKLIKGQNQSTEGDLDADLARYCENIISQSFNNQLEKPKKPELIEFSPQNTNKGGETAESLSENTGKLHSASQTGYETARDLFESQLREKIIADILKNPIYTKKIVAKRNKTDEMNFNSNNNNNDDDDIDDNINNKNNINDDDNDNNNSDDEDKNVTNADESENEYENNNDNNVTKKNKEESNFTEFETTDSTDSTEVTEVVTKTETDSHSTITECLIKKQKKLQKKEKAEKKLLEKGWSEEEIKMFQILKKRKKALISWLFNLKNQDKLDDLIETEYFDDDDLNAETETLKNSGTIKPKKGDKKSGRRKKNLIFDNETNFPIYAKRFGYNKGGELREVEVLWRKINQKTHEEKVLKNISVLALYMMAPNTSHEDTKLVVNNGYENEDMSEAEIKKENELGYTAGDAVETDEKTTVPAFLQNNKIFQDILNNTPFASASIKSIGTNLTHTFINRLDTSSIVGECPKMKKSHLNMTHKTSHKMEVAKDLFQEYTTEFVNYAVYILPIMLTIIFLFCCLCCALHILKAQRSLKRYRKKRKKQCTSQETSDTTEESGHCSKKKKREVKFKRSNKNPESDTVLDKTERKKTWGVLNLPSKPNDTLRGEIFQKRKKNTFLRFLKGAKEKYRDDESHGTDDRSEAADRRELIALLEEVKKIEMGQADDKKEIKSVQVQYMTQEDDSSAFRRSNVLYPYQKNDFGMPKGYSIYSKPYDCQQTAPPVIEGELYEDADELTELLPCECTYLSKKSDCLRHCDLSINEQDPCKRFLKIFRDSDVCQNRPFNEKNFVKNESEKRSFIFNKYRSISMDPSEEFMGVTQRNTGTDIASPFALPSQKNSGILREIDNLKRQLNSKKNVRLKDDGVLCRL